MDMALFYGVSPDYLNIMRIPLLRGRFIASQDNEKRPCVTVIDEEFPQKAFPAQDPIGQHINLDLIGVQCEIVGIVGHVKQWGLESDATSKIHSQMYLEYRQVPDGVMDLLSGGSEFVIRTTGSPYAVVPELKRTVNAINSSMVSYDEQGMEEVIRDSLLARRFTRMLLALFAALPMVLAVVGIYGVV